MTQWYVNTVEERHTMAEVMDDTDDILTEEILVFVRKEKDGTYSASCRFIPISGIGKTRGEAEENLHEFIKCRIEKDNFYKDERTLRFIHIDIIGKGK